MCGGDAISKFLVGWRLSANVLLLNYSGLFIKMKLKIFTFFLWPQLEIINISNRTGPIYIIVLHIICLNGCFIMYHAGIIAIQLLICRCNNSKKGTFLGDPLDYKDRKESLSGPETSDFIWTGRRN